MELRIIELRYNNVLYDLTFDREDAPASEGGPKSNVLKTWKINSVSIPLGSSCIQERIFRSDGKSSFEKVRLARTQKVLGVVAKFLGWPTLILGSSAPNTFDRKGSNLHLEWKEPFEELSDALPCSGPLENPECKLYKALRSMPDSPQLDNAESLLLSLKQFMDHLHSLCQACLQRELNSIWNGVYEMSKRILPEKSWPMAAFEGHYEVTLKRDIGLPSFVELPDLMDKDLVLLSRGEVELYSLHSKVRDRHSAQDTVINHGWQIIPRRRVASSTVTRSLTREAVKRVKAGASG
jgi:hypothetical protein